MFNSKFKICFLILFTLSILFHPQLSDAALKGSVYLTGFLDLVRQFNINVNILEMDQLLDVFKAVDFGKAEVGVTSNLLGVLNESGHSVERT